MALLSHNPMHHALVFDSGVGGLTVSREMRALMPALRQSYLADDAFRPYGAKTEAELRARLPELLSTVSDMLKPDIVVVACNTASTTALPSIRAVLDVPVVGVVPAIKPAAAASKTKSIGVLGTPGTVRRAYVDALIADHAGDCRVQLKGSVALVEEAEAKLAGRAVDLGRVKAELNGLLDNDVDAVVLACTHFPLLRDELQAVAPRHVQWVDSGAAIARRVENLLKEVTPNARAPYYETAFLTGPDSDENRRAAFIDYGFERVVSLME